MHKAPLVLKISGFHSEYFLQFDCVFLQFSQESDQITLENGLKNDFESKVFSFERQKIGDLREILLDFTLIQMQENVKALEILTEAHRHIADISVDDDLEVRVSRFIY